MRARILPATMGMNFLSTWGRILAFARQFLVIDLGTSESPATCKNPDEMSRTSLLFPDLMFFYIKTSREL